MKTICAMREVFRAMSSFETAFEKVYRITLNEAMILCILKDATERMLRILEEKGLIVRELGNEDRRQMYFHLSSTGKQRVSELEVDKVEMPELLKPLFK